MYPWNAPPVTVGVHLKISRKTVSVAIKLITQKHRSRIMLQHNFPASAFPAIRK
jgi:hypothetical protein